MKIPLTAEQKEAFFRQAVEAGLFQSAEDALEKALALWEERTFSTAKFSADIR